MKGSIPDMGVDLGMGIGASANHVGVGNIPVVDHAGVDMASCV